MAEKAAQKEFGFKEVETKSTSNGLLVRNIDELSRNWRLQRTYLWEVLLPDISGISGPEVSKYCQDVSFGEYNITDISKLRYGAFRTAYVGFFDIDNITLTFLSPVPDLVYVYFRSWKRLQITDSGLYYPKAKYAKTAYVKLFDRDGSENKSFKLTGVFPVKFPAYKLGYGDESVLKFDIVLNVDRIYES